MSFLKCTYFQYSIALTQSVQWLWKYIFWVSGGWTKIYIYKKACHLCKSFMQEILKIESLKKNMYNIYIFVHPPLTLLLSMIVNKEKNEIPTKKSGVFLSTLPWFRIYNLHSHGKLCVRAIEGWNPKFYYYGVVYCCLVLRAIYIIVFLWEHNSCPRIIIWLAGNKRST